MPRNYKTIDEINDALARHADDNPISDELEMAQVEEMMVKGYLTCPEAKTLRQRNKFFTSINFMGLQDFLEYAEGKKIA